MLGGTTSNSHHTYTYISASEIDSSEIGCYQPQAGSREINFLYFPSLNVTGALGGGSPQDVTGHWPGYVGRRCLQTGDGWTYRRLHRQTGDGWTYRRLPFWRLKIQVLCNYSEGQSAETVED